MKCIIKEPSRFIMWALGVILSLNSSPTTTMKPWHCQLSFKSYFENIRSCPVKSKFLWKQIKYHKKYVTSKFTWKESSPGIRVWIEFSLLPKEFVFPLQWLGLVCWYTWRGSSLLPGRSTSGSLKNHMYQRVGDFWFCLFNWGKIHIT